jgi:hypothetical protein
MPRARSPRSEKNKTKHKCLDLNALVVSPLPLLSMGAVRAFFQERRDSIWSFSKPLHLCGSCGSFLLLCLQFCGSLAPELFELQSHPE